MAKTLKEIINERRKLLTPGKESDKKKSKLAEILDKKKNKEQTKETVDNRPPVMIPAADMEKYEKMLEEFESAKKSKADESSLKKSFEEAREKTIDNDRLREGKGLDFTQFFKTNGIAEENYELASSVLRASGKNLTKENVEAEIAEIKKKFPILSHSTKIPPVVSGSDAAPGKKDYKNMDMAERAKAFSERLNQLTS